MTVRTQAPNREVSTNTGTLYIAFELSKNTWKVRMSDGARIAQHNVPGGDTEAVLKRVKEACAKFGLESPRLVSCYEAGRDGHWLHRFLTDRGFESLVVDPASIQVDRRAKHHKTDNADAEKLLRMLIRHHSGEPGVWRVIRVPSPEAEDARHLHRDLLSLKADRTSESNSLTAQLFAVGVRVKATPAFMRNELPELLAKARTGDGRELGEGLKARLRRLHRRWLEIDGQIRALRKEQSQRAAQPGGRSEAMAARICGLKGVGVQSASVLSHECFGWRDFKNRKEVAACAGLAPVHHASGALHRDLGISKSGNTLVRRTMVELAWLWLRFQPDSEIAKWYRRRTSGEGAPLSKMKAVTAVARKLLIALWRYAVHGVVPEGAVLSA